MAAILPGAAVLAVRREIKKKLKKAGAFSEDTAKKPEEICASEKWLRMRGVKRTDDGRYYIECEDKKHC
jgi:hypothetical protein